MKFEKKSKYHKKDEMQFSTQEIKSFKNTVIVIFEINGPIESENGPIESENGPIESENGPIESENGPIESENGPVERKNEPVKSENEPVKSENEPVKSENEPVEKRIFKLIEVNVNKTDLIMKETNKSRATVKRVLKKLQEENKIIKVEEGPKTYYKINETINK